MRRTLRCLSLLRPMRRPKALVTERLLGGIFTQKFWIAFLPAYSDLVQFLSIWQPTISSNFHRYDFSNSNCYIISCPERDRSCELGFMGGKMRWFSNLTKLPRAGPRNWG